MKLIDLTGQRFGRLVVIKRVENDKHKKPKWKCMCDCGNIKIVLGAILKRGESKSCGCLLKEKMIEYNTTHGMYYTKIHRAWAGMKQRCGNKNIESYKYYGERGISVCDRWLNSFEFFLEDMGESYEQHVEEFGEKETTIDRIDVNGNYCKENCRWATYKEQANNMRTNCLITYNGKTQNIKQWSEEIGIKYTTLFNRLNTYNWDIEKALIIPTLQ